MAWKEDSHFAATGSGRYAQALTQYFWGAPLGRVFFVSSVYGTDDAAGGYGLSPVTPFATIAYALLQCDGTNDDYVVPMPGHTETVVGAAGLLLSVAGVTVMGWPLARGRQRPKINFTTAAGASLDITAARCRLSNLWLKNSIDAQTAMVNISAADAVLEDLEVELADASTQATLGILTTAAADRLSVSRCHFHGTLDAGVTAVISLVGGDSIVIKDNVIFGAHSTSGSIFNQTTACTGLHILRNAITNLTADGNNKAINVHASTDGLIADNRIAIIDSTSPAPVTAAAMYVSGNYFTGAAGVGAASTLL